MNAHIVVGLVALGWGVAVPLGIRVLPARGHARWIPLTWLPASAVWLAAAAASVNPLGFSDEIVLLTSAHFVHAGFGVSSLLVAVGCRRGLWVHQVGMVTVAAGLSGVTLLQPLGATVIVAALATYAVAAMRLSRSVALWRRALLVVSAVAWCSPMLLAMSWALGQAGLTRSARTLDQMVAQHGAVNAIGVVIAGLAALSPTRVGTVRLGAATEQEDHDDHRSTAYG